MYEFMDRLMTVALPRVRNFRGINDKSFDGRGNYTLGVQEQIIFPEISIDKVNRISGMDITFVTTANTDEEILLVFNASAGDEEPETEQRMIERLNGKATAEEHRRWTKTWAS